MDLKRGIDTAIEKVIEEIKKNSKKVKTNEEIAQVGTISANGEKEIGDMISQAMQKSATKVLLLLKRLKVCKLN